MKPLRDYQSRDYNALKRSLKKNRRVLFCAPTGYGKTRVSAEHVIESRKKGLTCLFLAPWRELITQTANRFREFGLEPGILMSGHEPDFDQPVQVGSIETVRRWLDRYPEIADADIVHVDEAHRMGTEARQTLITETFAKATVVGFSATPFRPDLGGMGEFFDDLVMAAQASELMDDGFLVPGEFYSADPRELAGQPFSILPIGQDYEPSLLSEYCQRPDIIGDIVSDYSEVCPGAKALAFAVDVQHSLDLCEAFEEAGYSAAHIDGETPSTERERVLDKLRDGSLDVVTNCQVLTEGFDLPALECVILKPTNSLRLYLQMVGRGLRPAEGKTSCVILDPGGSVYRFGLPEDRRIYTLEGLREEKEPNDEPARAEHTISRVRPAGAAHLRTPVHAEGELSAFDKERSPEQLLESLREQAASAGLGPAWVVEQYRHATGEVPADYTERTISWLNKVAVQRGYDEAWVTKRVASLFL